MPVPAFTTEDLDGNEVTESILKDKDVTMINIWGTFCPPCIEEMPELAKLSASLPENAQIIGILCDVSLNDKSALQDAKSIVSKAGTNYPCLLLNDSLTDYLSQFMYVPTTINDFRRQRRESDRRAGRRSRFQCLYGTPPESDR